MITGCAGFIGNRVVEEFLNDKKYKVLGLDCMTYAGKESNIQRFLKNPRFCFFKENICNQQAINNICKNHNISWIINVAAETHVDNSIEDCSSFLKSNVLGVHSLLNVCKENKIKLLHFSTDEVYGVAPEGLTFNEFQSINPRNPYSATKAAADHLILSYENTYNIKSIIVRPSNNYGPNQNPEKLLPKLIQNIGLRKKLPVYGDGNQKREWTYVKDTAKACKFILENGELGQIYNITSGEELTNLSLIKIVSKKMGVSFENIIEFVKDRPGHDTRYSISSKKLHNLGFKKYTTLEEGLKDMKL